MKRIVTAIAVGICLTASVFGQNGKLDPYLDKKVTDYKNAQGTNKQNKGKEVVQVILRTNPGQNVAAENAASQAGGKAVRRFGILSGTVVQLPVQAVEQM